MDVITDLHVIPLWTGLEVAINYSSHRLTAKKTQDRNMYEEENEIHKKKVQKLMSTSLNVNELSKTLLSSTKNSLQKITKFSIEARNSTAEFTIQNLHR